MARPGLNPSLALFSTKVIFTGNPHLIDRMRGQKIYAHITLEKGERSELAELASDLL